MRLIPAFLLLSCLAPQIKPTEATHEKVAKVFAPNEKETHFSSLTQLTFEGENAEAYWNFKGTGVSMQRRGVLDGCDKIFKMDVFSPEGKLDPKMTQLSSGKGATTCSHFTHDDQRIIFASTHLSGDECPKKPDMSQGYVWALYDSYEIFSMKPDGSDVQQLTNSKGYDAEGTVCAKDGSIVFTSVRDGDIDLYRMDADGKNVKRLTKGLGYDGGAFFNRDCSKLVWRASRPKPGKETEDYLGLLAQGLVRPSKMELWVGNADGTDAHQVTNLGAASFAPFFFPDGKRILFSSNYGDSKNREFDIFAIDVNGTHLERITHTPGFDGFPMFSPDGKWLMFSSNRATEIGKNDTNLFLAEWNPTIGEMVPLTADLAQNDVSFLSDEKREGRGLGSNGIESAAQYIETRFKALKVGPAFGDSVFRNEFKVETKRSVKSIGFSVGGKEIGGAMPLSFSSEGTVSGDAVFAEYGIVDGDLKINDYKNLNVKNKVVIVRRFVPAEITKVEDQRRLGDLRKKAFTAKSLGAKALVVVDLGDGSNGSEAAFPSLRADSDEGLMSIMAPRKEMISVIEELKKKKMVKISLQLTFDREFKNTANIVGLVKGMDSTLAPLVIGAHYDHLGFGGPNSLMPNSTAAHLGADDNASGVAAVLSVAEFVAKHPLQRDVIFVAFSGEEEGLLGSAALLKSKPQLAKAHAMFNFDMVGRMRESLSVLGVDSALELKHLIETACQNSRVSCVVSGDGYGPSDHMSFFIAGVPVLHFFTGAHTDYHKPSDSAELINATGIAQVSQLVEQIADTLDSQTLTFQKSSSPIQLSGDTRSFGASLGTVPNYSSTLKGVLLDDVRVGSAADKGGLKKGDLLIQLGSDVLSSVHDLMFVLQKSKPGETVKATFVRDEKTLEVDVTFQQSVRH
jgi:Tol biopolymer transport system component